MEKKHHVVINMSGNGSLDVALAREEALHRFRDINWATYTRAGGFSLEKTEIAALKDLECVIQPTFDGTMNVRTYARFFHVKFPTNSPCLDQSRGRIPQWCVGNHPFQHHQNTIINCFLCFRTVIVSGSLVGSALLKLVKNVTELTVLRYCLARMEELLPGTRQYNVELLGSKLHMSTADHPQTDGQTERANRVVADVFRTIATPKEWSKQLPFVELAINNSVHASTGETPFNGLRHPRTPVSFVRSPSLRGEGPLTMLGAKEGYPMRVSSQRLKLALVTLPV
ncbi:hypothetical protein CCR75_004772 [Bremia lactucae]|uniref:Integrase catalytic domain-containing protein n=1 Tax=Bremia lactucae TaxID=4779 RepID=A0A976IFK0_BRELC|nr:hypothetical protein CCR75_004772 [Bremia lactucae]